MSFPFPLEQSDRREEINRSRVGEEWVWVGVSGERGEADRMSPPLWVSSCQFTYLDRPGILAPKTVYLILLLEQILERAVKLLVTYKNRKHLALPQGWGHNGYSHPAWVGGEAWLKAHCALLHTTPAFRDKNELLITY